MKGRPEPNPIKVKQVKETLEDINSYPIVGLLNLHKMPAAALQKLKYDLKDKMKVKVLKKAVIERALEQSNKKSLLEHMNNQPALIFTKENPFAICKAIKKNKKPAFAKTGDVALNDIEISAGPTELLPGPAISTLSKAKIPSKVENGKIAILRDVVVKKKGEVVDADLASILQMLKIKPMEIGLNISAMWEDNVIYLKDVLDIDEEKTIADLNEAVIAAMNLSINAGYVTKDNVKVMIIKAFNEAKTICLDSGLVSKDIIGDILFNIVSEMKVDDKVETKDEVKEETTKEDEKNE